MRTGTLPEPKETPESERSVDLVRPEEPDGQSHELLGKEGPGRIQLELEEARRKSARGIALMLKKAERDDCWSTFYWALIREGDLAGAYWLGRTPLGDRLSAVPSWLLEALVGAQSVFSDTSSFVVDLRDITRLYQPGDCDCEQLLGLAAALGPALVAPTTGMMGWLKVPKCCPALHDLVSSVLAFASYGKAIRPIDLQGVRGAEEWDMLIRQKASEIRSRVEEARSKRTGYKRASAVWRELIARETAPGGMLFPVVNHDRDQVEDVRKRLQGWSDRSLIEGWIDRVDRELVGRKLRAHNGEPPPAAHTQHCGGVQLGIGVVRAGRICKRGRAERCTLDWRPNKRATFATTGSPAPGSYRNGRAYPRT